MNQICSNLIEIDQQVAGANSGPLKNGAHLPPLCARGRSCSSKAWLYSDSTSHGRTNGDSRWPWKEQPRPGGHAGSRMAPGRSTRCPCSRPSGRAARTHSPARSCSSVAWLSAIAGLMDALWVTAVAAEGATAPPGGHAPRLDRQLTGISFVRRSSLFVPNRPA